MAELTPMMQQYLSIKQQTPGAILFFRLGDFYEMFFEDALTASRELELTLTGRDCGLEERAPMCGVPWHAADSYITRLVKKGYQVAVCEQTEDPSAARGLVRREVVRVVTPGTLSDFSSLEERRNNFIASVFVSGSRAGMALCDVTTGEFFLRPLADAGPDLEAALSARMPSEVITNAPDQVKGFTEACLQPRPAADFSSEKAREALLAHFQVSALQALGLDRSHTSAVAAGGALIAYLSETQKNALSHISALRVLAPSDTMPLDLATRRNLELTESLRSRTLQGSLLWLLDRTQTAMGGRMLRAWVEAPLLDVSLIRERLSAVSFLHGEPVLAEEASGCLSRVYDMERLLSKISYGTFNGRDCLALLRSLRQAPRVLELLKPAQAAGIRGLCELIDPLSELADLLEEAIDPDTPALLTEGGVIRKGYSQELDGIRAAATEGRQWLADLEARERERTGIRNLRVQYNRVFGYYIEVTKSNLALVPPEYRRRQTLASSERYATEELAEIERRVLGAQDEAVKLETKLFDGVRDRVAAELRALQRTAQGFKTLDALVSLARVARENGFICPVLSEEGEMDIRDGRHPVVEKTLGGLHFVPNDTAMDGGDRRMLIITGPNMAGKSTYLRQTALITLMAHIGSFVPATSALVPLVDNIFTRVGASDDLASGQSTFMVEMSELAFILRTATQRSLVILDEIGRGTSTFDGLSIAWATVEYLADPKRVGAKTLFATHYHELSELQGVLQGVQNYCVSVRELGEEVVFLHKIMPGGADKSFGVHVAKLAGVPGPVIARAREIQARLEVNDINQVAIGKNILEKRGGRKNRQMELLEFGKTELVEELSGMDVLSMSPMDALNALFLLREKARKL